MYFQHTPEIWSQFPELVPGMLAVEGISSDVDVSEAVARYSAIAAQRLDGRTESELPEIQAWRRGFGKMGLKPTQYRCASEALLRRFRNEGALPSILPLIDLYNAISIAYAIPIGVLDADKVAGGITVCHAKGDERYTTFGGEIETPYEGEVIFRDDDGWAHARRWTNRQSGRSAVSTDTTRVVFVCEAVHETAREDVSRLLESVSTELQSIWGVSSHTMILTPENPRFESVIG